MSSVCSGFSPSVHRLWREWSASLKTRRNGWGNHRALSSQGWSRQPVNREAEELEEWKPFRKRRKEVKKWYWAILRLVKKLQQSRPSTTGGKPGKWSNGLTRVFKYPHTYGKLIFDVVSKVILWRNRALSTNGVGTTGYTLFSASLLHLTSYTKVNSMDYKSAWKIHNL